MSIGVAIQSAIFYYAGCTPCIDLYQKRAKQKRAIRDTKERGKNPITEGYEHPVAMNTNPFWKEEMDIGPVLPRKKKSFGPIRAGSQRRLTNQTDSSASMGTLASKHSAGTSPTLTDQRDREGSGDEWNTRPHQRQDEELWGVHTRHSGRHPSFASTQADTILSSDGLPETSEHPKLGHRLVDAVFKAGESAGRLIEAAKSPLSSREVSDEDRSSFYRSSIINPPVNDFHPPVVSSRPAHADGHKWMLQPPPSAAVMEGRVPVSRSSSMASQVSSRRATSFGEIAPLGRLVHEKLLRRKEVSTVNDGYFAAEARRYSTTRYGTSRVSDSKSVMSKLSIHVHGHIGTRSRGLSFDSSTHEVTSMRRSRAKRMTLDQMSWSHPSEEDQEFSPSGNTPRPARADCNDAPMTIQEVPTTDELAHEKDSELGQRENGDISDGGESSSGEKGGLLEPTKAPQLST